MSEGREPSEATKRWLRVECAMRFSQKGSTFGGSVKRKGKEVLATGGLPREVSAALCWVRKV